jgi:OmpR-family two-component system manganese-sensing response regulator
LAKILLIEDDEQLIGPLVRWLKLDGHVVDHVSTGQDALQMLSSYQFDLVVIDWGLPDMPGMDVMKRFRAGGAATPVIFLTGRDDVKSKKEGLDSGADDYVTKPFQSEELSARIRSILRRPAGLIPTKFTVHNVVIEFDTKKVYLAGAPISLGKREYAVLEFLIRHPNRTFSSQDLITAVWPSDTEVGEDAVRSCVKELRTKLTAKDGTCIISTVHGAGYTVKTE